MPDDSAGGGRVPPRAGLTFETNFAALVAAHARRRGDERMLDSEAWRGEVLELFGYTVVRDAGDDANTWFMGANIEGKASFPLFYFGPAIDYVNRCADEAAANYPNFSFR
jgi:hypothetical protein